MGGVSIIAIFLGLVLLDFAVDQSEILWRRPDRRARVERIERWAMLTLAVAFLPLIAYAVSQGRLWSAAAAAFGVFVMLNSRRGMKREREL